MNTDYCHSRRKFLQHSGTVLAGTLLLENLTGNAFGKTPRPAPVKVNAHLWVYASSSRPIGILPLIWKWYLLI